MQTMLDTHRFLYNHALAERKDAWEQHQRSVSYIDQSAQLKAERMVNPFMQRTNFSSCQATLRRLDKAFKAFFRRTKAGEDPGYPRFKGPDRFDTVEYPSYCDGCKITDNRVYFQHIGSVRILLHRPIEGTIKTLSFSRRADDWFLIVSCDLGPVAMRHQAPAAAVGIDVGLMHFATLSTGEQVANPRFFRRDHQALVKAQRRLTKEAKGTPERTARKRVVRRIYERIANRRSDSAHKLSRRLTSLFGVIVFEDLAITQMIKNPTWRKVLRMPHEIS